MAKPDTIPTPQRELSGKLAGLTLAQQVMILALWPFLEQVLSFLVGFVDTALAGHFNVDAADAIGPGGYIEWFMGLETFLIRLSAAYIIGHAIGLGLAAVWIGLCAELALRGVIFGARFLHGG